MPETELSGLSELKPAVLLIIILILPIKSDCQVYPDHKVDSTLKFGINQIILQNYEGAGKTFFNLGLNYPELPLGNIYLAAVQIAKSYDYGNDYDESYIDSLLTLAEKQSLELLKKENNTWNRYFLSLSEGYLAYFKALNGEWLSSLSLGIDALRNFETLLDKDAGFYDAYIAIGTFKYWKSRKTEFLDWLPGYHDERAEGISLLEKAFNHQTYNSYLAINSLIWVYIDRHEYKKAADIAQRALEKYPGSRFFKWGLARAYEETDTQKSIQIYQEILDSLPKLSNHYNEITLKHIIAQQFAKINETQNALKLCNEILNIKQIDAKTRSRLGNRLQRVAELKRELSR